MSKFWLHGGYTDFTMARAKSSVPIDTSQACDLTMGLIERFRCPPEKSQAFLRDLKSPGLRVRATSNGSKSFVFEAKLHRKTVRQTIGDVRAWSIEAARVESNRLRVTLDSGVDPRLLELQRREAESTLAKSQQRQETTVGEAWASYLQERATVWRPRTLYDHQRISAEGGKSSSRGTKGRGLTIPGPIYPLLALRLAELGPCKVESWAAEQGRLRPTYGRLAWRCLKAFLTWCSQDERYKGLCQPDVAKGRKVREAFGKPVVRQDVIERDQLAPWFRAVREISNPAISACLQVILLTGARENEVLGLQWDHVDWTWNRLTLSDKVEDQRVIPLTKCVRQLLGSLPRTSKWVFASPTAKAGVITVPRKAHVLACTKAGIEYLTLHGLRRSFGSLSEWLDIPTGIVSQIMGHKPSATAEKHYRVRPIDLLRQHHQRYEDWILEQAQLVPVGDAPHGLRLINA
jgi:integrase